jgi:hypothetical protein
MNGLTVEQSKEYNQTEGELFQIYFRLLDEVIRLEQKGVEAPKYRRVTDEFKEASEWIVNDANKFLLYGHGAGNTTAKPGTNPHTTEL